MCSYIKVIKETYHDLMNFFGNRFNKKNISTFYEFYYKFVND